VPVLVCNGSGPPTMTWTESGELGDPATDAARLGNKGGCEAALTAAFRAGYRIGKGTK
jgi:hypothetical protein